MRIGLCCGMDIAPLARDGGFDYVEIATSGFSTREDFRAEEYRALAAEASNVFFPPSIKLFGPDATPYMEYAKTAVDRADAIGIRTIVIGSGAARTAPPGVDPSWAETRFVEIATEISAYASNYGIEVAPESLGRAESNVGTDLGRLAKALSAKGVGYTADSYHVLFEWRADGGDGEPSPELWADQIPFLPCHVHLGTLPRTAPWESDLLLIGFVGRLQELGYDGRVSVESTLTGSDVATLRRVSNQIRELFG